MSTAMRLVRNARTGFITIATGATPTLIVGPRPNTGGNLATTGVKGGSASYRTMLKIQNAAAVDIYVGPKVNDTGATLVTGPIDTDGAGALIPASSLTWHEFPGFFGSLYGVVSGATPGQLRYIEIY